MNFFKNIFSKNHSENKDQRKAECPSCHAALKKIPGSKTKCPYCGEFMYVRTRPKDDVRLVVTKKEADKIDEEWTIVAGTHDQYLFEKKEFDDQRKMLQKRYGKEPSENDIKWGLFNKHLLEHMTNGDWGLYRNTKSQMAQQLERELKFKNALLTFFDVCYLDLNGATNSIKVEGGLASEELLNEFPPFDPELAFLAPGIIHDIKLISKKLSLSEDDMQKLFIDRCHKFYKSMKLPVSPEDAWDKISAEIQNQKLE